MESLFLQLISDFHFGVFREGEKNWQFPCWIAPFFSLFRNGFLPRKLQDLPRDPLHQRSSSFSHSHKRCADSRRRRRHRSSIVHQTVGALHQVFHDLVLSLRALTSTQARNEDWGSCIYPGYLGEFVKHRYRRRQSTGFDSSSMKLSSWKLGRPIWARVLGARPP